MQAENLVKYADKLIYMGGVDTQDLLPFKSAAEVEKEVFRLRNLFGRHFICSPSHEALLENVPFENLMALSRACRAKI